MRPIIKNIISTLLVMFVLTINSLHAEILHPYNTKIIRGSISNQPLSVLKAKDQTGKQDNWSKYIEAKPNNKHFIGDFFFKTTVRTQWEKIEVRINTISEASNSQKWSFQLYNFSTKKWSTIGNNAKARNWIWYRKNLTVSKNVNDFIASNGFIRLRYRSNNNVDVSNIDYLNIRLTKKLTHDNRWWKPSPSENISWQWQINGTVNTNLPVKMYDVDLFDTSKQTIQKLKNSGKVVICYFSAGTYEGWRPDWQQFFPFIKGESYNGKRAPFAGKMDSWDERWLDIRRIDLLSKIMRSRLDLAVSKGCDGVEPDNMDGYTNRSETRIPLNYQNQLIFNKWIAKEAHERGLSVGLKNDVDQLADLVGDFDWALNEQCFQYNECNDYEIFIAADKAVFGVEYSGSPSNFCPKANNMHFSWLKKKLSLNAWRIGCEKY